ncbi:MAG: protein phosphatase 2C domain-containing protein [Nocardioidaceae bacterium]
MTFSLRFAAVTDIGRTRKKNDDSGYAGDHFLMVADGMGGAPAGDLASAVAVQTMQRLDTTPPGANPPEATPPEGLLEALAGAVHRANDRLAELIDEDASVSGMGTTVSAALFDGSRIGVAHLGDSRGYLWRDRELLRITHDHTWVQDLIDEGRITEEEAAVHSHRSLLLKVLDGRHDNEPDLTVYDVRAGDRILLCSDGLSGFVDHDRIERVMAVGTAASTAAELTHLALEAGSTDNVTVVIGDVVEEAPIDTEPIVVGAAASNPRRALSRLRNWAQRDETQSGEMLMVDSDVDPEELRYAPREPRRLLWLRRTAIIVVLVVLVVAGGVLAYGWSQTQYFVASDAGHVAIYQGVQADLPGVRLHHVYQQQTLLLSELPSFRRSQVLTGMPADNLTDARRIVHRLTTFATTCAAQTAAATTTPTTPTGPPRTATTSVGPTSTTGKPTRPATGNPTPRQPGTHAQSPLTTAPKVPVESPRATSGATSPDHNSPQECAGATPASGPTP